MVAGGNIFQTAVAAAFHFPPLLLLRVISSFLQSLHLKSHLYFLIFYPCHLALTVVVVLLADRLASIWRPLQDIVLKKLKLYLSNHYNAIMGCYLSFRSFMHIIVKGR